MVGQPEVAHGVVIANIADHFAKQALVVGQLPVVDILADDVAKKTAEVFVAGERQE